MPSLGRALRERAGDLRGVGVGGDEELLAPSGVAGYPGPDLGFETHAQHEAIIHRARGKTQLGGTWT